MTRDVNNVPNTGILVRDEPLEFFKLDEIDRCVFFWLIDHEKLRASIRSWLEYIDKDYQRRIRKTLDIDRLYEEAIACFPNGCEKKSKKISYKRKKPHKLHVNINPLRYAPPKNLL